MAKGTKRGTISRRAPILLRALDCINSSDYDDQGEYIIFGKELDEILDEAGLLSHEVQDSPDREPLRKLVSDKIGRAHV